MLPDVLGPDLKIVFCGTAAGQKSADLGYYYAGNGNKFWKTLFSTELTPRLLLPSEFRELIAWGIGLTDMVKDKSVWTAVWFEAISGITGLLRR